jgi:hypothetical protein
MDGSCWNATTMANGGSKKRGRFVPSNSTGATRCSSREANSTKSCEHWQMQSVGTGTPDQATRPRMTSRERESNARPAALQEFPRDILPSRDTLHSGRRLSALWPKQVQIWNDTSHRIEHVGAIVNEMRYPELTAMHRLLGPLETEPYLDALAAFGNDPHSPAESTYERRNDVEHALIGRGAQGVLQ